MEDLPPAPFAKNSTNSFWYLEFETRHNADYYREMISNTWQMTTILCLVYVALCFALQKWMSTRKEMKLRRSLIIWNWGLAIFSMIGAERFFFVFREAATDFHNVVCNKDALGGYPITGLWLYLFSLSKIFELGDTLFLIFRKRPLSFLHWYHHASVLFFSWYWHITRYPPSYMLAEINYSIHSFMYTYYAVRAMGFSTYKILAMAITSTQIMQMLFAVFMSIYGMVTKFMGVECDHLSHHSLSAFLWYISFTILFSNFFIQTYIRDKKRQTRKLV